MVHVVSPTIARWRHFSKNKSSTSTSNQWKTLLGGSTHLLSPRLVWLCTSRTPRTRCVQSSVYGDLVIVTWCCSPEIVDIMGDGGDLEKQPTCLTELSSSFVSKFESAFFRYICSEFLCTKFRVMKGEKGLRVTATPTMTLEVSSSL